MGLQELKSSGGVVYSLYSSTSPEAGGQVGVVPVAMSRGWRPGPPPHGGVDCGEAGACTVAPFAAGADA